MNVEDHIGGTVVDLCIEMSLHVDVELVDLLLGVLSRSGLLSDNVGKCHEYYRIYSQCIVQETTDNLLDDFLLASSRRGLSSVGISA